MSVCRANMTMTAFKAASYIRRSAVLAQRIIYGAEPPRNFNQYSSQDVSGGGGGPGGGMHEESRGLAHDEDR
ncbi:hypothetical protein IAT40_000255 [Kwoniella sp. CBS 6097]